MNLTDEKIIEMAVDHLGICYDRMPHGVLMFARALLATPPAAALAPVAKPYRYSAFENFTVREVSPTPSTPAPKNCQTGWADFCKASQHDGVACPADSCDIDDGVRKDHAPSTPAPVAIVTHVPRLGCLRTIAVGPLDIHTLKMGDKLYAATESIALTNSIANALYDSIEEVLLHHCVSNMEGDDGESYRLVDRLSTPGAKSVESGQLEVRLICDAIYNEVLTVTAPPARPDVGDSQEQVLEDESDGSWAAFELSHHAQMSDKMDRWPVWLDAWYAAMLAPQSSEKEVGETKETK